MTAIDVIEQRTRELPPEYQQKVLDFIDTLLLDLHTVKLVKPCISWAGGLSDLQEDVFIIQKKALLWRDTDEVRPERSTDEDFDDTERDSSGNQCNISGTDSMFPENSGP